MDGDDIRMVERRSRACFLLEAPQPFWVVGELRSKYFYDDIAVELVIFGFVDLTHAAGPDELEDFVSARRAPMSKGTSGSLARAA